jgi:flagellar hook assembly protein FlgD
LSPTVTLTPSPTPTNVFGYPLVLSANVFNDVSDPALRVDYWVINGGDVQVRVYNVAGATIRHLAAGAQSPGGYSLFWNGLDDYGQQASTGLYIIALIQPSRLDIKKVAVVKQ